MAEFDPFRDSGAVALDDPSFDPFKEGAIPVDEFDPFKEGAVPLDVPQETGSAGPVGSAAVKPVATVTPKLTAGDAVTGISEGVTAAASARTLASNIGREFLGGAAGATADIVGGAARTAADVMTGGSERPEIQKWEKKVMDISQKRSVRDDYTPEEIANMTEAPPGYRSPKEEIDLEVAKWHLGNLRGREKGAKVVREPLEDIQRLSSLASEESKTFFGQDPARQDEFLSHLASGAGSLPPYIASAMAGGPGLSMLTGALQTGQNEYNAAIESGHPELADEAMAKGLSIGLTEGAGVGGGMSAPAKSYGAKALKVLLKGFEEGGQEWVQQVLSNLNASTFTGYDKGRKVGEGAGEAALIGFLLGGGAESLGQIRSGETEAEAPVAVTAADAARPIPPLDKMRTAPLTEPGAQTTFMDPALQRDALDGLVKTRQALARDIDQQSAEAQTARRQSIAEIDAQLERYGPEAVRDAEARTAAPTPPPIVAVPPAPTATPGGPSPQDSAAEAAAQLSKTAAAAAETAPLAAAEAAKLANEVQQTVVPQRRVKGPALVDSQGNVLIEGAIGQTHAQLKIEAAKRGIDATEGEHVFLDESGTPMNRYLAASVADAAGQRPPGIGGPLQSEHLTVETPAAPPSPEVAAPPVGTETASAIPPTDTASQTTETTLPPETAPIGAAPVEPSSATIEGEVPEAATTAPIEPKTSPESAPIQKTVPEGSSSTQAATSAPRRLSSKQFDVLESEVADEPAPPAPSPAKPAEPALRIVPAGKKRLKIVNAAGEQVGKRTYATQARAELALSKIGKKSPFNLPPSDDGNDIIDAIIEEGGINLSGMSKEERENVFPHKGIWRNALTTDNPNATPSGVAALLAPSQEKIDVGEMSYGDGDERTMFDLITQAVAARKKRRGERIYQASVQKAGEKKARAFEAAISDESPGEEKIAVSELKMGDVILINGEECTVADIDPDTGDVTFKDGKKFGQQTVEDGRIIYGEKLEPDYQDINKAIDFAADAARLASEEATDDYIARHKLEEAATEEELSAGGTGEEESGGTPDAKGKTGVADVAPSGTQPPAQKVETPLERARRIVATQEANQILAREDGDYELAASLERVLPKLRRDLAAEEAKANQVAPVGPAPPAEPEPPVEMWQRKREAVGEQLAKHREAVKNAVAKKLPVPDEVLAEYAGSVWADKEIRRRSKAEKEAVDEVNAPTPPKEEEPAAEYQPPKRPEGDALSEGAKGNYENWKASMDAYKKAFAKWVESIPANKAIIFKNNSKYGAQYAAVTRDTGGDWRITRFDSELEMPLGHNVFKTRLEAAEELSSWERIEKLPFTVKAGEYHQQRTPYLWLKKEGEEPRLVKFGGYLKGGETATVMDAKDVYNGEWETVTADDLSLPTKDETAVALKSEKEQFRVHDEQRTKERAEIRKEIERTGIAEVPGGDVRIKPSDVEDGKFDLVQTVNGERKIISNPEHPGTLEEMQNGAVHAAQRLRSAAPKTKTAEPTKAEPPTDLLTPDTTNTGTSANVTNEDAGTLVRVGGQVVAKLNQNKSGEFVPELNDAGQKLTAEQKALVDTAAKDYTKTWRAAKVREGAAKPMAAADLTTQLDMLETGKSETPLFEQPTTEKPKDKIEQFLDDAIEKLKNKPGELFADPFFIQSVGKPVLRAALQVVKATYTTTRDAAKAIADGMAYLRANVQNLDEAKAQEFFDSLYEQEGEAPPQEGAPKPTPSALPDTTAAYNAETDKLLTASGFEPIAAPARKALGESWDQAKAIADSDPGRGSRLVAELNENPRTLEDDVESGILLHELATRKAEQARAQSELFKAVASGDQAAIDAANERLRIARNATYEAITAAKATGTAWGRAGRFRQVHIDQDFSLVAMEAAWRSEVNKGAPLSEDQAKMIAGLHAKIAESEAKLEEYRQKEEKAEAQRIYDEVLKEAKKEASAAKKTGGKITSFIHDQAQKARERIIARRGKLFATVDPLNIAGLVDEAIIGADYIAQGITKLGDWSSKMLETFGDRLKPFLPALFDKSKEYHDSVSEGMGPGTAKETPADVLAGAVPDEPLDPRLVFNLARAHVNAGVEGMENVMKAVHDDLVQIYPELTEREVRDAFSGYGKVTYPSKEEDLTKLREYRNLARLTSQLEDAERRVAPLKTGPQRDKASAKVRELTKAVKEAVRRLGLETTNPAQQLKTSLDAIKTRLKNQIEDIGKQIATKTKPPGRTPIPYDAEATELRAERDRLQAISDDIFGKPQLTDAQRIAAATKALDKAIAEEDAMLKAGILKREPKAGKTPSTPELEAKRSMLDAMRDLRKDLREAANPKTSPEEKALEGALKSAQASIDLYDEMLKSGNLKSPEKAPKFSPTDELETLWSQRNALRDAVNELRAATRPKASKEESARKAAIKALDKRLAELDRRIKTGDFSSAPKAPGKASAFADVQKKRAEVAELRKVYEAMRKATLPKRTEEEIRLARDKKMIANRTAELERRVRDGDYAPRPKKPAVMDKEKSDLLYENAKAKEAFNKALFEEKLRQRTFGRKVFDTAREVLNTSRAILTSMDLSGVLRQGGFIAFAHPIRAAKSIVPMLKAFASEKSAHAAAEEIKSRPNAPLYETSKLYLADQNSHSLTKQEEAFMSRWANKIPLVAGSQRAYTTFLNKLRADSFDAMAKSLGSGATLTSEEGKAIANFINVATGRGSIPGKAAQAAAGLNSIFFAPRFVISRFQLLAGQPFYGGNARTRALIAGEYARYLAGMALVYALAGLDPDKDDLVTDPTSSDFLKLKWHGTRLDPMSGLLQATVFTTREGEAIRRFITQDKSKEPKYGSGADVLGRFLRSKLNPAIGTVVDALAHKDVTGQEVTPISALKRLGVPLSFGDILKTMEEQGVPRGTALSVLALFGMGLQTYADKKKTPTPSYR